MDREKVVDFLQHISLNAYEYRDSNNEILGYPYLEAEKIADDALALLKEQENASKRNPVIVCPHCGKRIK